MYIFRLSDDYLSFDDATSESIQTMHSTALPMHLCPVKPAHMHMCSVKPAHMHVPRQARSPCTCAPSSPLAKVNVLNSLFLVRVRVFVLFVMFARLANLA